MARRYRIWQQSTLQYFCLVKTAACILVCQDLTNTSERQAEFNLFKKTINDECIPLIHLTTIEDKKNRFQRVELILTHKLAKIKSDQEICSTGKRSVFKNESNNEFRTETSYAELEESKKRTITRTNPLGLAFLKLDAGLRFCWNVAMPLIPSTSTWLLGIDEEGDGTRFLSTIMAAPNWSRHLVKLQWLEWIRTELHRFVR